MVSIDKAWIDWDLAADLANDKKWCMVFFDVVRTERILGEFRPEGVEIAMRRSGKMHRLYNPPRTRPARRPRGPLAQWARGSIGPAFVFGGADDGGLGDAAAEMGEGEGAQGADEAHDDESNADAEEAALEALAGAGDPQGGEGQGEGEGGDNDASGDGDGSSSEEKSGDGADGSNEDGVDPDHGDGDGDSNSGESVSQDDDDVPEPPHPHPAPRRLPKWPQIVCDKGTENLSYINLSQPKGKPCKDMRSVCGDCGRTLSQTCHLSRPIGRLWAWLLYPCGGDRDCHGEFEPAFSDRDDARAAFYTIDGTEAWFEAEDSTGGDFDPLFEPYD